MINYLLTTFIIFSTGLIFADDHSSSEKEVLSDGVRFVLEEADAIKILGTGEIKAKINIEANLASKSAVEKLEKIGGSIQLKK